MRKQQVLRSLVIVSMMCAASLFAAESEARQGPPSPPGNLAVTVSGSTVQLTWTAPPQQVAAYRLQAGSASGLSNLANTIVGANPALTAPGVPPGTYYVRVRAINGSGESAPSNEVVFVVGAAPPGGCASPPNAPVSLV